MSTVPSKRFVTPAEYLALEEAASSKHEYYRGEIFDMAGGSIRHNEISGNIYFRLRSALQHGRCRPYNSDQRVKSQGPGLYTYADTFVVCGELKTDELNAETITNPSVIFEVLSPSTESYDRGQKFEFYQQIDSLRDYVLVSQVEPKITHFIRADDGSWRYELISGLEMSLVLKSIECTLRLADIYDNLSFSN